ncbi:HAMP domain-containing protein [Marinobacterium halophilum]|uniref:HAMP domain-containing protein n=1 Tax=Marinobacterium halophilum TaxID=267374 RepID=A0A2P8F310_9GAMM|nr:HD domain-containing phosphohydrolase [Marinobacterium halophilum]PSL16102.1 HAMP domain-containing protein [Marinobacterium halophilum]
MNRTLNAGMRLRWIISLSVMAGTLLLSAILISSAYFSHREVLVQASEQMAHQMAGSLDSASTRLLHPLKSSLRLLTHDPLLRTATLEQRLQRLPVLAETLDANPMISAVYVGYADHDFLLLRKLRHPRFQQTLAAPVGSAWLLQSINKASRQWLFYSETLQLLEARDVPEYAFDPHQRDWYRQALSSDEPVLTPPYLFFTTAEVGVTLSVAGPERTVVGIDASVQDISVQLESLKPDSHYRMAVVTPQGQVVAWPDVQNMIRTEAQSVRLATLSELDAPELSELQRLAPAGGEMVHYLFDERDWYGIRMPLLAMNGEALELLVTVPSAELLAGARQQGIAMLYWSLLAALVMLLLGWWGSVRLARPLDQLADQVGALSRFDFRHRVSSRSMVYEVNMLARVLDRMASAIVHFQAISHTLARERELSQMLPTVASHLKASIEARECVIYLYDGDTHQLHLNTDVHTAGEQGVPQALDCPQASATAQTDAVRTMLGEQADEWLMTPLTGRETHPAGVMALRLAAGKWADATLDRFVAELSGSAAVAIETRQLVEAQKRLMEAIIRLLADAIDAKSPHTSGHCERVPELAQMLADAAVDSRQGPFADFAMSRAERYEFHLAAWLHDCGKITTPEHVLDKATKLDALYNRIHEVRTRFEVLWRDAEIEYLQGVIETGDEVLLRERKRQRQQQLQQDFEYVAHINMGGESLSDEAVAEIRRIGAQEWWRHFDNRPGLSHEELERMPEDDTTTLPVKETLLADRPEHYQPWNGARPPVEVGNPANSWGFDMQLPEAEWNLGELYNLTQRYGTLTPEERFTINNHIVQTIRMLNQLPWPENLKRVPDIAGNHHERMDGGGYPRRLSAADLGIPERIMALADVFEALTAADRPYKTAKPLSESLRIMALMARNGHLDPELFTLFLTSGIYLRYAERYLSPAQIDPVDQRQLLTLMTN